MVAGEGNENRQGGQCEPHSTVFEGVALLHCIFVASTWMQECWKLVVRSFVQKVFVINLFSGKPNVMAYKTTTWTFYDIFE